MFWLKLCIWCCLHEYTVVWYESVNKKTGGLGTKASRGWLSLFLISAFWVASKGKENSRSSLFSQYKEKERVSSLFRALSFSPLTSLWLLLLFWFGRSRETRVFSLTVSSLSLTLSFSNSHSLGWCKKTNEIKRIKRTFISFQISSLTKYINFVIYFG
jgi:uncharacterized BrkB/YihY/UPF0761 family membrane protein